jgi:hypothetical protein
MFRKHGYVMTLAAYRWSTNQHKQEHASNEICSLQFKPEHITVLIILTYLIQISRLPQNLILVSSINNQIEYYFQKLRNLYAMHTLRI